MIIPTPEQMQIIDENSNCVVIAQPGSGKTSTLALKIKKILQNLPQYKGVVAISYTNKASNELKKRSLEGGTDIKGSFFGTIDKFYLSEIILSFGKHIFGMPSEEIEIEIPSSEPIQSTINHIVEQGYQGLQDDDIQWISEQYVDGKVYLPLVGIMSLYVFDRSFACQNYLKSRYSHIIIDEYQDSGEEQHSLFIRLKDIGLIGVAVGDLNQSIYSFSKKDSKFLLALTQDVTFIVHFLSKNHRCHVSIREYSSKLIRNDYVVQNIDEIRVFEKRVLGSEIDITEWLNDVIPTLAERYQVNQFSDIAILVRGNRTGIIVDSSLMLEHKYFIPSPLDQESSIWGTVFRGVLGVIFDQSMTAYEFLEQFSDRNVSVSVSRRIMREITELRRISEENPTSLLENMDKFIFIASSLAPSGENRNAIKFLRRVLSDESILNSCKPAKNNEIQIMTLHKSKGLEFDLVFHLDLYDYILPMYGSDYIQELNLHYVGITRAKKCCVLCTSSKRHNRNGKINANPSPFLTRNGLDSIREQLQIIM